MAEFHKEASSERPVHPLLFVERASATRGLYLAIEQAMNIQNEARSALQQMPHEVLAPEGQLFSIRPREAGQNIRFGKFFPPGIRYGSCLLEPRQMQIWPDDEPFLADRLVVVNTDVFAVSLDGWAREVSIGNEDFIFVPRPQDSQAA